MVQMFLIFLFCLLYLFAVLENLSIRRAANRIKINVSHCRHLLQKRRLLDHHTHRGPHRDSRCVIMSRENLHRMLSVSGAQSLGVLNPLPGIKQTHVVV